MCYREHLIKVHILSFELCKNNNQTTTIYNTIQVPIYHLKRSCLIKIFLTLNK